MKNAARTLSLVWVALTLAVTAVGWLLTHPLESTVDPWDDDIARSIADQRTPDGEFLAKWGSHVADTIVGVIIAALAALILWRVQRTRVPLVYFTVLVVGTLALYLVVTLLISRDRPPVKILDPGLVPEHSFPSGHVATSVVVYCALAVYLLRTVPRSRPWAWLLFLAPVIVAPSRLYEGAHHLTDVLTSLVFAPLWVWAVAHVLLSREPHESRP